MSKQYTQVVDFNRAILKIAKRPVGIQDPDEFMLSMTQLKEEIGEIEEAYKHQDFVELIDGLIDLEYFLLGIFYKNGLSSKTHEDIFTAVHIANLNKKAGIKKGREGFSAADANKPEDWVSPEQAIIDILEGL